MSSTTSQERRLGIVARAGSWAAHHRRLVLIGWIVLLVGSLGISHAVGTNYSTNFSLPGTESQRATDLLKRDFPAQSGDSDQIVLRAREGQITDPAVRAQVEPMLKEVAALPARDGRGQPLLARRGARGVHRRADRVRDASTSTSAPTSCSKASIENVISTAERARSNAARGAARRPGDRTGAETVARNGHRGGAARGHDHPVHHLRLAAGDGAADRDRAARARHRHRVGGAGLADHRRAELRDRARGHDRARRGHRLRAVHRDALPRELPGGRRAPAGDRRRDGLGRTGGAVRGRHRDHRPARPVPARRELPVRARGRLGAGGADDDARRPHGSARRAVAPRRAHRAPEPPRAGEPAGARRRAARLLGLVGQRDPTPPLAGGSRGAGDHARAGGARARAATGQQRRGQQPAQRHHQAGLRPDRQGLRPRLQRPPGGRREPPPRRRQRGPGERRRHAEGDGERGERLARAPEPQRPDGRVQRLPAQLAAVAGDD